MQKAPLFALLKYSFEVLNLTNLLSARQYFVDRELNKDLQPVRLPLHSFATTVALLAFQCRCGNE